jgi:hypothetical protein
MSTKHNNWRTWLRRGGGVVVGTFFVAFGLLSIMIVLGAMYHVGQAHGMWIFYASVAAAMVLLAGGGCMLIPESKKVTPGADE